MSLKDKCSVIYTTVQTADASLALFSLSTFDLLRSPLIHKQGKFPTNTMIATTIIEVFILFGGDASGPARSASMINENMTIINELNVHKTHELMDSDIGYVTRLQDGIRLRFKRSIVRISLISYFR
jgi:hypothetical protein